MLSATALPAHLVVIALLAALALRMFATAEEKGRGGLRWMLLFFTLWLGTLGLAAYGARWAFERHYHTLPGFWVLYGPAVACAFAVALALRWILAKRPALSAPETTAPEHTKPSPAPALLPTPRPQPAPVPLPTPPPEPIPPSEPTPFKFACPHCGQRLAVTTAEVGTAADCPNCGTPLVVPAPPAESVSSGEGMTNDE